MNRINFNKDWLFTNENNLSHFNGFGFEKYMEASGAAARFYDYSNWERVDLPHDWAVGLKKDLRANTFAGARANSHFHRFMTERRSNIGEIFNIGWYRKSFDAPENWKNKRVFLEFEGIFRDAAVWINGTYMDRHLSGYTSFILEITDHLLFGEENSVAVRVDSDQPEGWWYEGAGIYRNVYLYVSEPVYIKHNTTVIKTALDGTVFAEAVAFNDTPYEYKGIAAFEITDPNGETAASASGSVSVAPFSEARVKAKLKVSNPALWHVDSPNLYTLAVRIGSEEEKHAFGIRTVGFDAEKGFLLNGKPLKIRGACVHQDFGGVGIALTDNLQYYKIMRLKEMGVNAYRASHNAPAPALLKACDELGMLVMDETRMFGTSPEALKQLKDIIERDRNHPSVFIWSLGNEEFSVQNAPISRTLMEKMTRFAKSIDDTRLVTYGGNNGDDFTGANAASEVRGVNYIRNDSGKGGAWLDEYHAEHPSQPILGTEEASYVLSRGGGTTDLGSGKLDSSGLVTMPWGSTPKGWVKYFEERDFLSGSFMWTGFDYRGEPNPFVTSFVASSFGTIDLCGMEKPPFYYYKAWWTDSPVLFLSPHWNYKDGETAEISVFTNMEEITLYVNGREIETRTVNRFDAPVFRVPFEEGTVSVKGTRNGETYFSKLTTSKKSASVKVTNVLEGRNDEEISVFRLSALDEDGNFCPLSNDECEISVEDGRILGIGNGDPADLGRETPEYEAKEIFLRTFSNGNILYSVPQKEGNLHRRRFDFMEIETEPNGFEDDERRVARFTDSLEKEKTVTYKTTVSNVSGYEYIEFERMGANAEVFVNGVSVGDNFRRTGRISVSHARPYRFPVRFTEGENEIKVVLSVNDASALPFSGYVKIGKTVPAPVRVRLHYGRACVFVKCENGKRPSVSAEIRSAE